METVVKVYIKYKKKEILVAIGAYIKIDIRKYNFFSIASICFFNPNTLAHGFLPFYDSQV